MIKLGRLQVTLLNKICSVTKLGSFVEHSFNISQCSVVGLVMRILYETSENVVESNRACAFSDSLINKNLVFGTLQNCLNLFSLFSIASFGIIQKVKRNTDSENKIDVFNLFDFVSFVQHIFQNFIYIDFDAIP